MPRVSVVIPAYNAARFLGEAIRSTLDQSFQDFELIIIDDGSSDDTGKVVEGFSDPRIKYFYQENRGAPAAYNKGFNLSSGYYVLFLDADDVLVKDTLEKETAILDKYPETGFCFGQSWIMNEDGGIYRLRKSGLQESSGFVDRVQQIRELLFTCLITTSTVMARRDCLEQVKLFNEGMTSIAEDCHLYVRILKKFPVYYIAEPLAKYRVHSDQLHKRVDAQAAEKAFTAVFDEVFTDAHYSAQLHNWKGPAYFQSYSKIAAYAYGRDMALARYYMRKAFRAYPQVMVRRYGLALMFKYTASLLPVPIWNNLRSLKWRLVGTSLSTKE